MLTPITAFQPSSCGVAYEGVTTACVCTAPQGHAGAHSGARLDDINIADTPACLTNFTDATGRVRVCWRPLGHTDPALTGCASHWGPTHVDGECGITLGPSVNGRKVRCHKPFAHEGNHDSLLAAAHKIATLPENIQPNPAPAMISVATPPDSFPPREDLLNEFGDPINTCPSALHLHGNMHPCDHTAGHTSPFHSNADAGAFWN